MSGTKTKHPEVNRSRSGIDSHQIDRSICQPGWQPEEKVEVEIDKPARPSVVG